MSACRLVNTNRHASFFFLFPLFPLHAQVQQALLELCDMCPSLIEGQPGSRIKLEVLLQQGICSMSRAAKSSHNLMQTVCIAISPVTQAMCICSCSLVQDLHHALPEAALKAHDAEAWRRRFKNAQFNSTIDCSCHILESRCALHRHTAESLLALFHVMMDKMPQKCLL